METYTTDYIYYDFSFSFPFSYLITEKQLFLFIVNRFDPNYMLDNITSDNTLFSLNFELSLVNNITGEIYISVQNLFQMTKEYNLKEIFPLQFHFLFLEPNTYLQIKQL